MSEWPQLELSAAYDIERGCGSVTYLKQLTQVTSGTCVDCVWLDFDAGGARKLRTILVFKQFAVMEDAIRTIAAYEAAAGTPLEHQIARRLQPATKDVVEESSGWVDERGDRTSTVRIRRMGRRSVEVTFVHSRTDFVP